MPLKIAIIYNEPGPGRYVAMGEEKAVLGVLGEVAAVQQALTEMGYLVEQVPLSPPLDEVRRKLQALKVDLVFNLFEGFAGSPETEAAVAFILSELGLTYTGCPAPALSLGLDKVKTKLLLEASGLATPGYQLLNTATLSTFKLSFPCIVKPAAEDASHGLSEESVVHDFASLQRQVERVSRLFGGKALVEEFVNGGEFNVTVLGTREPEVLPVAEIVYTLPADKPRILTFSAKWEPESLYYQASQSVCPAAIDTGLRERLTNAARDAFRLLGGSGYARVDFRVDSAGQPEIIELNPNPDISPDAGAARQARAAGMTYNQFIARIVLLALEGTKEVRSITNLKIRPMTDRDKPVLMHILHNTPEFKPGEVVVAEEVLDSYLQDPSGSGYHVFVAEVNSVVTGYICYGPTPLTESTWDIYWMAVAPEKQGQGIGTALLASAEDNIKQARGRLILIETSSKPDYARTQRFYLLQGYDLAGRIADFYAPGDDELIFQKRFAG
ncbi:MAG: ATP-grasp protein [Dehalococcoidales bacterium]|nr:ATP-grasp protein [Dehalococcoidales bacterium]